MNYYLLFLVFACNLQLIFTDDGSWDYGLMIDAGSSHSNIHIYTWQRGTVALYDFPNFEEAPVNQIPWGDKVNQAISDFSDPKEAAASLKPLLDYAQSKIPQSQWYSTTLFLKATAGMRSLPVDRQQEIMEAVRDYLQETPFRFNREWARIISGSEEGIYGWITVNYLLSNFKYNSTNATAGALDLGGASTQITFATETPLEMDGFNVTFSGNLLYQTYTHSFLGYGNDQARYQLEDNLIRKNVSNLEVVNPCYPTGYLEIYSYNNTNYTIMGSSDSALCHSLVSELILTNVTCNYTSCSFNGVYQPPLPDHMDFYGFSGFAYMFSFFNLPSNSSLTAVNSVTTQYCDLTWNEIITKWNATKNPYLMNYCFFGHYVVSLLHDGYGFPMNTTNLIVDISLQNVELSWALGGMLYEMDYAPPFVFCDQLTTCDACLTNPACGWCNRNDLCVPGDKGGAFEGACESGWNMELKHCKTKKSLSNIILVVTAIGAVLVMVLIVGAIMFWRRRYQYRSYVPLETTE